MILSTDIKMVEGNIIEDKEKDLGWRKRHKYVKRSKDAAWRRQQEEYLTDCRKKHNKQHKPKGS